MTNTLVKTIYRRDKYQDLPDNTSVKEAFNNRDIDIINIESEDWNIFHEMEDVYLLQYPSRYFEFVAMNLNNPILSDIKVRQAILMGIDRDRILQDTTLGEGIGDRRPHFTIFMGL